MSNIFDIVSKNINIKDEIDRLIAMSEKEKIIEYNEDIFNPEYYNLFDFVEMYCFNTWKHRDHCVNVQDYLRVLNYNRIVKDAYVENESLLIMIELIYNFWMQAFIYVGSNNYMSYIGNFHHLKKVMDDLIEKHNYTTKHLDDNTMVRIIPNKPEVDAVVEMLPDKVGFDTVMFNHSSLKGDLAEKKRILIELGKELEPIRDKLKNEKKDLEDDIFCMLNNMDIRHNNTSEDDQKQFKSVVANMNDKQIEEWYDELYEMMLLGFLTVKNIDRKERVKVLRKKM